MNFAYSKGRFNQSLWECQPIPPGVLQPQILCPLHFCTFADLCTMRCVSLCVRGEWFRVPCGGPSASVRSLGSEALRRYHQAKKLEDGGREREFSMRRCQCGELLDPEDRAEDVLQDNDFVQLGKGLQLMNAN